MSLPYENASSGKSAIDDMAKLLRVFGASSFGTMEDFAAGKVIVQFEHRGRRVSIEASFGAMLPPGNGHIPTPPVPGVIEGGTRLWR